MLSKDAKASLIVGSWAQNSVVLQSDLRDSWHCCIKFYWATYKENVGDQSWSWTSSGPPGVCKQYCATGCSRVSTPETCGRVWFGCFDSYRIFTDLVILKEKQISQYRSVWVRPVKNNLLPRMAFEWQRRYQQRWRSLQTAICQYSATNGLGFHWSWKLIQDSNAPRHD